MFGSSAFLGQYFQVARGASPTEAGLLTLPMIAGNLVGGLGLTGTIDHTTELWLTGLYTAILGLGLGLLMQNLVLGLAAAGIPTGGGAGTSMDLKDMPEPVREIMRAAYGDATAQIFLVSAIVGLVALVAILFIKEEPLRRTVDIVTPSAKGDDDGGPAAESGPAAGTGIVDLDREFVEVLGQQRESQRRVR